MMATFTETFTHMRQDCDKAREQRHQLVQDNRERVQDNRERVKNITLAGFHQDHAEMARHLRTELKDLSTDLSAGGAIFRKESNPRKHR